MGRLRGWLGSDAQVPRLRRRLPRARNRRRNLSVGRSAPENRVHGCRVRLVGWFHGPTAAGFSSFEALSLSCLTTRGPRSCELILAPDLRYGPDSRAGSGGFRTEVAVA